MKVVFIAANQAEMENMADILENYFKKLSEYEKVFTVQTNGNTSIFKNYFPVFGHTYGGSMRIFPHNPGENCITVDGDLKDIEIVFRRFEIPEERFLNLLSETSP